MKPRQSDDPVPLKSFACLVVGFVMVASTPFLWFAVVAIGADRIDTPIRGRIAEALAIVSLVTLVGGAALFLGGIASIVAVHIRRR